MDDIADIYFMGMDSSFIGRHHVQETFHHRHREDQLASTAIPSLGGYGVAELEPFESQERGFEHAHHKKYAIPKSKEGEIIEQLGGSAEQPAVLQVNPKDAVAMYGVRMQMPDAPMLRRTFHTLVAMFQAGHN